MDWPGQLVDQRRTSHFSFNFMVLRSLRRITQRTCWALEFSEDCGYFFLYLLIATCLSLLTFR